MNLIKVSLGGVGFFFDLETDKIYNDAEGKRPLADYAFTDDEKEEMKTSAQLQIQAENRLSRSRQATPVKVTEIPEVPDYCQCPFSMIMRDEKTDLPYCAECKKLVNDGPEDPIGKVIDQYLASGSSSPSKFAKDYNRNNEDPEDLNNIYKPGEKPFDY